MLKRTIIYIGAFELPDKNAAAHRVLNNAKILRELEYNVVFIDVNRQKNDMRSEVKKKNVYGFECWSRKFPVSLYEWSSYLISIKDIKDILSKYENIDAIICYNYQAIALYKLMKYCNRKNIKIIADCSEWYEDKRIIKKLDTVLRMQYIHNKLNGIICISSYLEKYYKDKVNTIVLPPLVDIEEDKWKYNHIKVNKNKINFVYSGNPGKHKDKINYIIEILSRLDKVNYLFRIIGINREQYLSYYPEHKKIIDKLNEKIEFLGRVTHKESIQFIKEADYLFFIRENKRVNNAGFPTKFVESITCGTPVITTRTSDLDRYLNNRETGFFISIDSREETISDLNMILETSNESIIEMKKICRQSKTFYYKNYISNMKKFLDEIGV